MTPNSKYNSEGIYFIAIIIIYDVLFKIIDRNL